MRHFSLNALVVFLMAAVLAAPVAAQGWSASSGAKARLAGCHDDRPMVPMVPAPGPGSHQCCQSGHDLAFLLASSSPEMSLEVSALIRLPRSAVTLAMLLSLPNLAIVSGDPPILSPLRV